jgi:hypothetical protein
MPYGSAAREKVDNAPVLIHAVYACEGRGVGPPEHELLCAEMCPLERNKGMKGIMRKYVVLAIAAMALGAAPFALADATQSVYYGAGKKTQGDIGKAKPAAEIEVKGAATPTAKSTSGSLPFTGMDLGLVGLAGVGLAGMGYSLRRLARNTDR